MKGLCPRNKKGLAEMIARKADDHAGLLLLNGWLGWVNYMIL
jgi:hypothetical protein